MKEHRGPWRPFVAALFIQFAVSADVFAQAEGGVSRESDLLREASTLEAHGDYSGAERLLTRALEANPASLTGLLQMERVLMIQGRAAALLPILDRLLLEDPRSALAHQMRVRALSLLDRPGELQDAGELWIAATPALEVPYRELARIHHERGELDRSIALLERGRTAIPRPDALALEMGEAYAAAGRWHDAAREWARAVGADARGLHAVERRLNLLSDGGARVLPELVDALDAPGSGPARLRAAAILAVDAGLMRDAQSIAKRVAAALDRTSRERFLTEMARRADGAGLARLAYWAYDALEDASEESETQLWAIRTRMADLALVVGDTARAVELYRKMERAFDRGSPERRTALGTRVALAARDGDVPAADRALAAFRREFPAAPELDSIAANVGAAELLRGDIEGAHSVITGIAGPHTTRLKGLLALRSGDLDGARELLLRALPGLHGESATQTIALAALLLRLSPAGGALVAEVAVGGPPGNDGTDQLLRRSAWLPAHERTALLDFAADIAVTSGRAEDARAFRQVVVEEHPDAPEAPTAMLALARGLASSPAAAEEARILLARLIVDYPRSALVPQARRELERLATAGATR